jgi:branched-subunit amino acid aminotransferase/4-amino-4-deoxychorismate lyase
MSTVYETMRVMSGTVPFLERHIRRLTTNARKAGLAEPPDTSRAIADAIERDESGKVDRAIRLYWDGQVLTVKLQDMPSRAPMKIITASVRHDGYEVKTTDRDTFDRARAEAAASGADDALLLTPEGFVAEGTLFAVGWFEAETLRVPTLDLGILPSIGRERMLELAEQLGFVVEEGRFLRAEIEGRPVFAVTATRGIVRIATLDGIPVTDDERITVLDEAFWRGS